MVSEAPPGAVVELGSHTVTVGLKRLHSTGVSHFRYGEEIRSTVVCRIDVAHFHGLSFLPVCLTIDVYLSHP